MFRLLLLLVTDGVLAADHLFQRRLASVLADGEGIRENPAELLGRQEVVIGPLRRHATATVLGLLVGLSFFCGFFICVIQGPRRQVGPAAPSELLISFAGFAILWLISGRLFAHLFRGGEMVLRPGGIVLRYRSQRVFCPWALFQGQGEPRDLGGGRWVVPAWQPAEDDVVQSRHGTVVATGGTARSMPLYFRRNGELVLRDLYAVRFRELAALLRDLGQRLGPQLPPGPNLQPGEPLPERME